MGKGQRARETRAQDRIDNPKKYSQKKKNNNKSKKSWLGPVIFVVAVLLVAGIFVSSYIEDNGFILRGKTAIKTDNFEVNGTMMQFAAMQSYQNFLTNYGSLVQYFGIDTSKKLSSQQYYDEDKTWLDNFMESAQTYVEEALVYAEAAKAEGIDLEEEDFTQIDNYIESLKNSAWQNGYSEKQFLSMLYGKGVKMGDIRDFYEITVLSDKYKAKINEETRDAVTDEEIENFYFENIDAHSIADVLYYSETIKIDKTLSEEEKEAKKAELLANIENIAAATSEEEFKSALEAYLTAKAEAAESKDVEKAVTEGLNNASATVAKADISLKEAAEWVFEVADKVYVRNAGEIKLFVDDASKAEEKTEESEEDKAEDTSSSTAKEDNYTVAVYYMVSAPKRNDAATKNVGHILLSLDAYGSDAAAKAKAEEVLDMYKAGEMTKESFEALAKEYTADTSVFYDNVASGEMVDEFDAWIFAPKRQTGDVEIVKTEDYGYHIIYFVGEGAPLWQAECLDGVTAEKTGDIFEGFEEKYPVTVDKATIKAIDC